MGLVTIGDECFLADDVSIAARESKHGWVRLGEVKLENRTFLGNSSRVRGDITVQSGVLAGVASEVPADNRPNDSFLGLPAISFARSQAQGDVELRYRPTPALRAKRLSVELFRLTTASFTFVFFSFCIQVAGVLPADPQSATLWAVKFGLLYAACGYLAILVTAAAKWALVWRVKKSSHNLWTNFVWRNELVWNYVESLAIPWVGSLTVDTSIQSTIFRLLGAKIGKNTSIATWFLDDPDLIEIGENCNIMKSADVQTHLFQDRVMQLDYVRLGDSADLGSGAFILPGVFVGSGSEISSGSLVTRNDHILPNSRLRGNPTESR
jgi:non-ribosomal peptide synthetase-like protein